MIREADREDQIAAARALPRMPRIQLPGCAGWKLRKPSNQRLQLRQRLVPHNQHAETRACGDHARANTPPVNTARLPPVNTHRGNHAVE